MDYIINAFGIRTSDGKTHIRVLYMFKSEGPNPHIFYYFTPNVIDSQYQTGYYYFIPDNLGNAATTNTGGTTTLSNLGINYTYDSSGFPKGQGYLINTVGAEIGITMSNNVSSANFENAILPLRGVYTNSIQLKTLPLNIRYKSENSKQLVAAVSEHIYGMDGTLSVFVDYYNSYINSTVKVDAKTIKTEISNFIISNKSLSPSTEEFRDWLASVIAIEMGAVHKDWAIVQTAIFSSIFAEDDDYAKVNDPFFTNKPDDPWRLKQFLNEKDSYFIGFVAGLGDGVIETADLAVNLTNFALNNSTPVLLFRLVTDTEKTVQEQLDNIKVAKDVVAVVFDKPKQEQIYNSIIDAIETWFDTATFQKTNVQAGYEHGKIVFEILGALIGVAEVKALLKYGKFSASALNAINKIDGIITKGFKFVKTDGAATLVNSIGNPISKGDDIARVLNNLADPINDVQKTVLDQFKQTVDNFVETIGDFTNARKGNWGEMATDVKLSQKGYIPLHKRINSIDAAGHNGIDGVFQKDGKYFIVESKYSKAGNPSLNPANSSTLLPKQMSDEWILNNNRLTDAVGSNLETLIRRDGYTRILATHGPNGTVKYNLVDALGNIGGVWTP